MKTKEAIWNEVFIMIAISFFFGFMTALQLSFGYPFSSFAIFDILFYFMALSINLLGLRATMKKIRG